MSARCRSCGARLSRYNRSLICAACARIESPWRSPDLREALTALDLGLMLSIIRREAGMSQLEMGQILGWSASQVHRVEHGQRQTLYDVRVLLQVCDALHMPRGVLKPLWLGASATGDDVVDMNRREFARAMLSAAALGALPLDIGSADARLPSRVDSGHVQFLRAAADRLYEQDQLVGGAALLEDAVKHLIRGRRMLLGSDVDNRIGRALMTAVGELAVCPGWLSYDSGNHDLARTLYLEAIALADEADADDLSVKAREKLALLVVQTARLVGSPAPARQALRLAERASRAASHAEPRVHALLAAREAVAHATIGDRSAYRRAITSGWRELDHCSADQSGPTWLRFLSAAEVRAAEAKGRLYLGDATDAIQLYNLALAETRSPRNKLIYRAQRSAAIALSGDITTAVSEGLAVLPALGEVASPRTLRELAPVRAAALDSGADDLVEQYDAAAARLAA
jgi:transcriptional regulator with XRE-family HTH domain